MASRWASADAVLAASIFHYGQHTVQEAKRFMAQQGIPMRWLSAYADDDRNASANAMARKRSNGTSTAWCR